MPFGGIQHSGVLQHNNDILSEEHNKLFDRQLARSEGSSVGWNQHGKPPPPPLHTHGIMTMPEHSLILGRLLFHMAKVSSDHDKVFVQPGKTASISISCNILKYAADMADRRE
jgi:hypothetical protein